MVKKFEVGKVYYAYTSRWAMVNGKEKVISIKEYYLCVKRNDATGYVSFKRFYKDNSLSSSQVSRKVDFRYDLGKPVEELVRIGNGGYGDRHLIFASQKRD